ncbi:MAG: hypothetical protein R3Y13_02860 [bacterium]
MEIDKMEKKYVKGNKVQLIHLLLSGLFFTSPDEILFSNISSEDINKNQNNVLTKGFPNQLYPGDTINGLDAVNLCLELDKMYFRILLNRGIAIDNYYFIKKNKEVYLIQSNLREEGYVSDLFTREAIDALFKGYASGETARYIYLASKGLVYARNNKDGLVCDNFVIPSNETIRSDFTDNYNYSAQFASKLMNLGEDDSTKEVIKKEFTFEEIENQVIYGSAMTGTAQDYLIIYRNNKLEIYMFSIIYKKDNLFEVNFKKSSSQVNRDINVSSDIPYNQDAVITRKRTK